MAKFESLDPLFRPQSSHELPRSLFGTALLHAYITKEQTSIYAYPIPNNNKTSRLPRAFANFLNLGENCYVGFIDGLQAKLNGINVNDAGPWSCSVLAYLFYSFY